MYLDACRLPYRGGTRREYNLIHVRQLLQRIPTEALTGGHVPFVLSDRSIDEWVIHMNRSDDVIQTSSSSLSTAPPRWGGPFRFLISQEDRSKEGWDSLFRTNRSREELCRVQVPLVSSPSSASVILS